MDLLVVSPIILRFHAPATQQQRRIVSIMNPTDNTIVYKVKSKQPKLYNVKPNCNKIGPFEIAEFTVTLNAHDLQPLTEHKMIVQSVIVNKETEALQNPADVFQYTPEEAITNTRIEIIYEALPANDLSSLEEEADTQQLVSLFNICKTETEFFKNFQQQFRPLCDACKDKETNLPKPNKLTKWRHKAKCIGIATFMLCIGVGYYVKRYIDGIHAEKVYY